MGFPTSPSDGDEYTNILGTVYKYLSTDDKWYIINSVLINNDVYGVSWNGVTDIAPAKDAVYDIMNSVSGTLISVSGDYVTTSGTVDSYAAHLADVNAHIDNLTGITTRLHNDLGSIGVTDHHDPTGYESVSGDYLLTSGTVSDYVVVSGVAATALQNIVEDLTPQLGGDLDLNQNNILLDPTPTTNNTYNGTVISGTVDDGSTVYGNLLFKAADGNWERADASAVATMPAFGMALGAGAGTYGIMLRGVVRHDDWAWSQVGGTGDLLYVSETPGDPTQTRPSGSVVNVQVIGFALSDDEVMFNPSYSYGTWEA